MTAAARAWVYACPMTKMPLLRTSNPSERKTRRGRTTLLSPNTTTSGCPVSEQFMTKKGDRIKTVAKIIPHVQADQPELGRPVVGFSDGYKPTDSYRLLIHFA